MSYATLEVSQQDSAPVQLFQFNRGNTTWRYVALPALFTALTHDWTPEVISVGNISSSSDVPKDTISITLPITNAMAAAFLAYAPDAVTTVTVFRTHYDDPTNGLAIWKGRVLSVSVTVATVTLTCEPVFVSLRRLGLRETYQRSCRHIFGGQGCNVDREALKISRVVTSVVGAKVTVITLTSLEGYVGGSVKASDGTLRMIVGVSSGELTLMRPVLAILQDFQTLGSGGFSIYLYPGCDKSTGTCRDTHHNLGNHGGCPGITGINPMSGMSSVF